MRYQNDMLPSLRISLRGIEIYKNTVLQYLHSIENLKLIKTNHELRNLFSIETTVWWIAKFTLSIVILMPLIMTPFSTVFAGNHNILHISTAFGPPISTSDKRGFFDQLMAHACTRIGYKVEIDHPQAGRALMLTNSGFNDGDGPRVDTLDNLSSYPNLVRVEEKLMNIDFVAFTRDPNLSIQGWDDLLGHNVAIVTGWKILEKRLSHLSSLVKVKDVKHALLLLKYGRTDVVILDRYSGIVTAHDIGLAHFHINNPPLYSKSMYLYLNKNDSEVAKKLAIALRAMKQDGTYQRIYKETLSHVIAQQSNISR